MPNQEGSGPTKPKRRPSSEGRRQGICQLAGDKPEIAPPATVRNIGVSRVDVLGITPCKDGALVWLWSPHASLTRVGVYPVERAFRLAADMLTRLPGCKPFIARGAIG